MPSLRSRLSERSTLPQWAVDYLFCKGKRNSEDGLEHPILGGLATRGRHSAMHLPPGRLGSRAELFLGAALLEARAQWERSADTSLKTRCGDSVSPL